MDQEKNQECCPKFDPAPWDGKVFEWEGKKFIKDKVFTLFFMPINFGAVIKRMVAKTEAAEAATPENLCLSDHTSKWSMDLYLAVDKDVPGAKNITLSGKFLSKVYEGPFKDTGKWREDFGKYAKEKGMTVGKMYMWYTTCPKCEKKYGHNYVAILAEVAN
ncbi:MAG: hydrolase [Candidatus Falkowbacteria bacterium]